MTSLVWHLMCHLMWFLLLLPATSGTEVCMECQPLAVQRSPGIAFDLTMAYGTAVIRYENGTVVDVIKVPGSTQYLSTMREFAEDAERVLAGDKSTLPRLDIRPHVAENKLTDALLKFDFSKLHSCIVAKLQKYITSPLTSPDFGPDERVMALAGMISDLKRATNDIYPLKYPFIKLSVPDFEVAAGYVHSEHFLSATKQAGLDLLLGVGRAYHDALRYHGIEDCSDEIDHEDLDCVLAEGRVDVVLLVSYNGASLGISLLTRWIDKLWGSFWPARLSENTQLGAYSQLLAQNPEKYWQKVKDATRLVVGTDYVEKTIFLGEYGMSKELQHMVLEVLEENKDTKGRSKVSRIGTGGENESLFAVARGASLAAREGMITRFDGCLVPDHCEKLEDQELNGDKRSEL